MKFSKIVQIVVIISVIGGCLLSLMNFSLKDTDRDRCYDRVARELGVAPTYEAISTTIYAKVGQILVPGMTREEVRVALETIAPVSVTRDDPTLDGGVAEYTILKLCKFIENNVVLMIYYTPGGKLEEVRLTRDD